MAGQSAAAVRRPSRWARAEVLAVSGASRVDAAVDCVGGDAVAVSQKLLKDPSRVASIVDPEVTRLGGHHVFTQPVPEDLAALAALAGKIVLDIG